jgi:Ribbon-helix-helix protein, copG family
MAKRKIHAAKRKRGRPATTGIGTLVGVRCHQDFLKRLDAWCKEHGKISRPDAIRRLAELGLKRDNSFSR